MCSSSIMREEIIWISMEIIFSIEFHLGKKMDYMIDTNY
jgi:hypothetical protein